MCCSPAVMYSTITEKTIICPYDSAHRILPSRIQYHLVKCREKHPDADMFICPFNAIHHVPKSEQQHHIGVCPDRRVVEAQMYHFDVTPPNYHGNLSVPAYNTVEIPADDDSEVNIKTVKIFHPQSKIRRGCAVRMLHAPAKLERKESPVQETEFGENHQSELISPDSNSTVSLDATESLNPLTDDCVPLRKPTEAPHALKQKMYPSWGLGRGILSYSQWADRVPGCHVQEGAPLLANTEDKRAKAATGFARGQGLLHGWHHNSTLPDEEKPVGQGTYSSAPSSIHMYSTAVDREVTEEFCSASAAGIHGQQPLDDRQSCELEKLSAQEPGSLDRIGPRIALQDENSHGILERRENEESFSRVKETLSQVDNFIQENQKGRTLSQEEERELSLLGDLLEQLKHIRLSKDHGGDKE